MATKPKKGLGRGLEALLEAANGKTTLFKPSELNNLEPSIDLADGILQQLSIVQIQPGKYQPRKIFRQDELNELANSIAQNGVIQPVVVRRLAPQKFELIAGERRWRASQLAGLSEIPAIIRKFSDEEALAVSIIENIQRQDLNIVEEAHGYRRLVDEFGLTHEQLAKVTGKSRSNISNILRLLNLAPSIIDLLLHNHLDMGHARALLPLTSEYQQILAQEIILKKLTTAEVENKVAKILHEQKHTKNDELVKKSDPDINSLEQRLADKLGMCVTIKHNPRNGMGKLTISYSSLDELDGFLAKF